MDWTILIFLYLFFQRPTHSSLAPNVETGCGQGSSQWTSSLADTTSSSGFQSTSLTALCRAEACSPSPRRPLANISFYLTFIFIQHFFYLTFFLFNIFLFIFNIYWNIYFHNIPYINTLQGKLQSQPPFSNSNIYYNIG